MSERSRYPNIYLRSKSEIAKRISGSQLPYPKALALVNDVLKNFDSYWKDNTEESEPEKGKYVRTAAGTPLGRLLKLIDRKILAPYDYLVPGFIFGGLSGRNHILATKHLLGEKRRRTLRGLDITRFFEQITEARVFYFFHKKAGCSKEASQLLARLCCVPGNAKGSTEGKTLARGFATSSRLALWCNLDTFLRVMWKAKEQLKGHDARVAIYVDDVGITASSVTKERMEQVSSVIEEILKNFDPNQSLPIQPKKAHTSEYLKGMQHLGLQIGRTSLGMGKKSQSKYHKVRNALKSVSTSPERRRLLQKKKSYHVYKAQIKKVLSLPDMGKRQ